MALLLNMNLTCWVCILQPTVLKVCGCNLTFGVVLNLSVWRGCTKFISTVVAVLIFSIKINMYTICRLFFFPAFKVFSLSFVSMAFGACLYSSWGLISQNTMGRVYCSHTAKSTAAAPTDLRGNESLGLPPYPPVHAVCSRFWLYKENRRNLFLGLGKSEILPHFWSSSCGVFYSSWVSRAVFPYRESSWSAVHLLQLWRDFVTCKGTL